MSVINVANSIPKPSETAIGIKNLACISVSVSIGISPAKVVSDVSMIGLNRLDPAVQADSRAVIPRAL